MTGVEEITFQSDEGTIVVTNAPQRACISELALESFSPFVSMSDGLVVFSVANGRWWYRPMGRPNATQTILLDLVRHEEA